MVAYTGTSQHLGTSALIFYNSMLSLPFLIIASLAAGEWEAVAAHPHILEPQFLLTLFICLSFGNLLTYTQFLCTEKNSALTTTVVGQLKVVISTLIGWALWGGSFNLMHLSGTALNTLGGVFYVHSKHLESKRRQNH
mmetsp:Transcript_18161/g.43435  ORF Transcript_18161/g.43435 Transcript_18161/m.43435 type:complete len:138 (-) Transcript_18161:805-1218(-)